MSIVPGTDESSLEAHIEHTRGRARIRQGLGIVAVAVLSGAAAMHAESRAITVQGSSLTVFVYKTGLFSAFADNHVIRAPLVEGSVSEEPPLAVSVLVHSAELEVIDPGLAPTRRAEIQARMLGSEVLDATRYPDIAFTSTAIDVTGLERWTVTGRLTIHGQSRVVMFTVTRRSRRYRGDVSLKQRDFGIEPITVLGGTVKVKDELKVQFDVAVLDAPPAF